MSSTHGSKKSPRFGPWSEWEWNEQYSCLSRWREADDGKTEFEYDEAPTANTPRSYEYPAPAGLGPDGEQPLQEEADQQGDNYIYAEEITRELAATNLGGPAVNTTHETPAATSVTRRHIQTTDPRTEVDSLDKSYKIHHSRDFKFGRIFKVLWSEPSGSGGTELTNLRRAKYGQNAYHSIRRFIVVGENEGHSLCLPILTYGGQGTLKRGVHPETHAIIYSETSARAFKGERITKRSIRMEPKTSRDKLDHASRVNYAKIYTVEHNVKVKFVGKVMPRDEQQLVTDYNLTVGRLPDRPNLGSRAESRYTSDQYSQYSNPGGPSPPGNAPSYGATQDHEINTQPAEDEWEHEQEQTRSGQYQYDPSLYEAESETEE